MKGHSLHYTNAFKIPNAQLTSAYTFVAEFMQLI